MTNKRFRKALAWFLASALLLLFAAGCGPSDTTEPTGEPMDGGSVTVAITQEPNILNPFTAEAAGDKEILFNIYEGLLKPDSDGIMHGALATEYDMSDDAMTYTFTIRQGVVFHNGEPMTLDDVVYSLEKAAGLDGSEHLEGMGGIESVEAPDSETVVLHLTEPDVELAPFLITPIVPVGTADTDDTDPENVIPALLDSEPIGTGPFSFGSYTIGQNLILEKNADYWMANVPILDEVVFKIVADMDAAFLELKAGTLDIFPYLSFERESEITDLYNTLEDQKNMVQIFALNNDRAPFDDVRVRQAMNLAVDRQGLIDQLNAGHGTPLTSGMSPAMGDNYNADLEGRFDTDVEEAKRLLAEAGYPEGFSTTVTAPSNYSLHVDTAIILAEQLKAVGIDLEILQVDWATWLEKVYVGRDYDSTVIALTSEFTPKDVLSRYDTDYSGNLINFTNDEYDTVFATIQASVDMEERIAGYHRLQEILVDEAASVYLQDPATMVAVNKSIGGYVPFPVYVQDLSTVYRIG